MSAAGPIVRWFTKVRSVWSYAVWVITLLYVFALGVGISQAKSLGAASLVDYSAAGLEPSIATLCLVLATLAAPDLFSGGRLRMPQPITIPLIWAVFMVIARLSYGVAGWSIVSAPVTEGITSIWGQTSLIGLVYLGQVLMLVVFMKVQQSKDRQA